ncbi:MAG TPA: VWA domain-containing protein [Candidatus Limnocylindrales bacterium]|nr:VWA domain-containing protein [Candidatus Limnocylindrales bacterium]
MAADDEGRGAWDDGRVRGEPFVRNALLFGRILRRVGLSADLPAVLDFGRALTLVDLGHREEVRAAGAALFCRRREDLAPYQLAFERFWRRHMALQETATPPAADALELADERPAGPGERGQRESGAEDADEEAGAEAATALAVAPEAYSAAESLRHRDFERMSTLELRAAARLIDRLMPTLEQRRTRRWELHPHGSIVAPRQMLRRNLSTGGDPLTWLWRRPVRRPRSIVLICDISGSMERHSRLLLRFAQALTRSRVPTEAFVFGTRLTRVTRQLRGRDPDLALTRVADAVTDWSGGTRIGASFAEFNRRWARRSLRSSGVVVVVSDGWDRGDPALVGSETARLRRNCHRLIWLNPLAGADGYRPLAAGMAAAYPYLDDFLPANDLASLERLAEVLGRQGVRPRATGFGAAEAGVSRPVGPGRTSPPLVSPYPLPSDGAA